MSFFIYFALGGHNIHSKETMILDIEMMLIVPVWSSPTSIQGTGRWAWNIWADSVGAGWLTAEIKAIVSHQLIAEDGQEKRGGFPEQLRIIAAHSLHLGALWKYKISTSLVMWMLSWWPLFWELEGCNSPYGARGLCGQDAEISLNLNLSFGLFYGYLDSYNLLVTCITPHWSQRRCFWRVYHAIDVHTTRSAGDCGQ